MNLKPGFKRVACGGILLSCAFLYHGSNVAAEANATRALSARQRNLAFNQSQSDENATVAPSQVDDGDDDDDERAFAVFESVKKASAKAMRSIKTNAIVNKVLDRDQKLEKTKALFDKYQLKQNDPAKFFSDYKVIWWISDTSIIYGWDKEKAYAAMFSTLLSRWKGDEEAVAKLIGSPSSHLPHLWINAQVNHWKARNLNTERVFDLLKLRKEGTELLNSPKLSSWVKFAEANDEEPAEKLWDYLTTRRVLKGKSDDKTPKKAFSTAELGKLLQPTRKTPSAMQLGPLLEPKLLARWKQEKYPIVDALQDVGIRQPNLDVWLAYIRTMDNDDPYTIFATAGKFEDKAIAGAIGLALQSENKLTAETGEKMLRAQIEDWTNNFGEGFKRFDGLFQDLELNDAGKNLFASPLWTVWTSYLRYVNEVNADNAMMNILKAHFNKEELLGIAEEAEKVASTKSIASFVKAHFSGEYRDPVSAQGVP